jgi:hypothetical protein
VIFLEIQILDPATLDIIAKFIITDASFLVASDSLKKEYISLQNHNSFSLLKRIKSNNLFKYLFEFELNNSNNIEQATVSLIAHDLNKKYPKLLYLINKKRSPL